MSFIWEGQFGFSQIIKTMNKRQRKKLFKKLSLTHSVIIVGKNMWVKPDEPIGEKIIFTLKIAI